MGDRHATSIVGRYGRGIGHWVDPLTQAPGPFAVSVLVFLEFLSDLGFAVVLLFFELFPGLKRPKEKERERVK